MTVDLELLSDSERDVIEALRSRGFVVVVWTPAEVEDAYQPLELPDQPGWTPA